MEKTYKVTIEAKRGVRISGSAIQSAVFGTGNFGAFRNVSVVETVPAKVEFVNPLYALGRKSKSGKGWKLLDFFNTEKRAVNAVARAVANYKGCALHGEFAVLAFDPTMGDWRVEGKTTKA